MMTLQDIAEKLGAGVEGPVNIEINSVAGLREARSGEISFLSNKKYASLVASSKASAIIVPEEWDGEAKATLIRMSNPDAAFAKVAEWFAPPPVVPVSGVHPSAVIADDVELGEGHSIGPNVVIESGAKLGANVTIMAGVYIGQGVTLGNDCYIHANATIREYSRIGNGFILHSGAVIGSDGFGYSVDEKGMRTKIPQIGIVVIGDDVEIGACVTVDRARFGQTRICNGAKIDNLVQIAHNVVIGESAVIVSQVGISGSTIVGAKAILAGKVGVAGHLHIGDGAIIGGKAGVTKDVPAGQYMYGFPAIPFKDASRQRAHVSRLPQLKARVDELEARLDKLES
jgi:UDP-3-O-[3-hydroxymyristoyl] glucosamine N-acyltransferase